MTCPLCGVPLVKRLLSGWVCGNLLCGRYDRGDEAERVRQKWEAEVKLCTDAMDRMQRELAYRRAAMEGRCDS